MGAAFPCPSLGGAVELTAEREFHILARHPELRWFLRQRIGETVLRPDRIRRSRRSSGSRLFARCYAGGGKARHVVVVVVTDPGVERRHWIVTAYMTRKLRGGEAEWKAS